MSELSPAQQLREDAWATLKAMHDQANGTAEPSLMAAGGWCAPSTKSYTVGLGTELIIPFVKVPKGGVTFP